MNRAQEALKLAQDWYDSGHEDPDEFTAMIKEVIALAEQSAQQQEPVAWRELYRRLYVELYWCDRQMMETLDEDGEPMWTQGKTVRDVLADARAALETSPPASKPWVELSVDEMVALVKKYRDAPVALVAATEAKLREKNT